MTFAPIAFAITTADVPTPPHPKTANHSPADRHARSVSALNAVVTRHPIAAAISKLSEPGRLTRLKSANRISTN